MKWQEAAISSAIKHIVHHLKYYFLLLSIIKHIPPANR